MMTAGRLDHRRVVTVTPAMMAVADGRCLGDLVAVVMTGGRGCRGGG